MTALLIDNMPLLAGAPNGVKKLRELILELAVSGKLVQQDPSDEPASELLTRVAKEKERLTSEEGLRTTARDDVPDDEHNFPSLPGWACCRLGNLARFIDYRGRTPTKTTYGVPLITAKNVRPGFISREPQEFIALDDYSSWMTRGFPRLGDMLFTTEAPMGNVAIIDITEQFALAQRVICFQLHELSTGPFLKLAIMSSGFQVQLSAAATGMTATGIKSSRLKEIPVPIPPLAEQQRIVSKVDELMTLCDRLETQQADAGIAHSQLVQALLDSLTQASDATDFATNWQRLAEHFHIMFTTEPSIDALKQTLLQLAVMGKLVPPESSDEPASELLKRIAEEKGQLMEEGKIRKQKPLGEITEEEKPYELPAAWAWTRLGSQVIESGAGWSPSCEARPRDGDEWGVLKVSAVSWGIYRPEENKALPPNLEARPEHEVAKGDFLVSRANTAELVARSVVVEETPNRLMLSDKIVRLKLTALCARRYVNLANSAPLARIYYSQVAGGTSSSMKNVSREQILNLPIALPPLAEQQRIVAKVDQIMLLCDTLKRQINVANEKQTILLNAVIAQV
ncbi:restriction endonuclease subunit S [Pseudomonas sp. GL-B-26]|uniref:restriction endonuclease subunit S n=1 Tax=Pseudomonas sp. GL-B-26 TaxID=2832394 RepID=UPI001CC178A6|nr:restriction endonuclease subunit S [Pseudomonas sp. GL-B-26]